MSTLSDEPRIQASASGKALIRFDKKTDSSCACTFYRFTSDGYLKTGAFTHSSELPDEVIFIESSNKLIAYKQAAKSLKEPVLFIYKTQKDWSHFTLSKSMSMEDIFKEGVEAKVLYFRGYFIWCYDSPVYKDKNFVYLNVSGRPDWLDYTTKDKMTCPSIRIDLATDQLHFETPELAAPQK